MVYTLLHTPQSLCFQTVDFMNRILALSSEFHCTWGHALSGHTAHLRLPCAEFLIWSPYSVHKTNLIKRAENLICSSLIHLHWQSACSFQQPSVDHLCRSSLSIPLWFPLSSSTSLSSDSPLCLPPLLSVSRGWHHSPRGALWQWQALIQHQVVPSMPPLCNTFRERLLPIISHASPHLSFYPPNPPPSNMPPLPR